MSVVRTYGTAYGTSRKGPGFYAVENGQRTSLFYKRQSNALDAAKRLCERLAADIRRNGHEVIVREQI